MKKVILWLIRIFKLDIPKKIVVEKIIYKDKEIVLTNEFNGDLFVNGDFKINGKLTVTGGITCYSSKDK